MDEQLARRLIFQHHTLGMQLDVLFGLLVRNRMDLAEEAIDELRQIARIAEPPEMREHLQQELAAWEQQVLVQRDLQQSGPPRDEPSR